MALTGRDLVEPAARELGVIGDGLPLDTNDAAVFVDLLSLIVDEWNAERDAIYATEFLTFTFTPSLNPHTIGPSGATWTVASSRPVTIEAATVILTPGANQVNAPQIRLHDQSVSIPVWYASLTSPTLTTSYPTDGYYDATWPNGSLYLWPVPSTAYDCQIQVRSVLTAWTLDTAFSMPPGYRSALIYTLAERGAAAFSRALSADLPDKARSARARIFSNNTGGRRISTIDSGMPRIAGGRTRSNYNWLTGMTNS